MSSFMQILIWFSSGLAVGSGFVAFITVLGVIPRLMKLSHAETYVKVFISSVILGTLLGTYFTFTENTWHDSFLLLLLFGVSHGIFNGVLAAALAETLNVFPILTKRLQLRKYLLSLLMAIVFGKVIGSLFQWLYFVKI